MSLRNNLIYSVRWHRRIGLLCALFVLVLSITGLLLNHTSSLKLSSIKIHSSMLASLYGLPTPAVTSIQVQEKWVSHDGSNQLYLGDQPISQCSAPLLGAVMHKNLLLVLLIKTASAVLNADLDTLQWQPSTINVPHWPKPQSPPAQLRQKLSAQAPAMNLEQILLDLHSGRLFGSFGVLVMDLAAILLVVLSITGFVAWNSSRLLRKNGKRK